MKLAIISVTEQGACLAAELAAKLPYDVDQYVKAGQQGDQKNRNIHTYDTLASLAAKIYSLYDGMIFLMATGIVVRVIAPFIRDKRVDPAIVAMDEQGRFAISLLAGHIGGANELASEVASLTGAQAVITTAADAAHRPAADVLAVKLDLTIEPFSELETINAAILSDERVSFFVDQDLVDPGYYSRLAAQMGITLHAMAELTKIEDYDAAVVITDKELYMVKPHLYLRPATLAVGIGCRKGTTSAELYSVICDACKKIGRSPKSIAVLGSSELKQEEIGLLALGEQLGVMTEFFTNDQMNHVIDRYHLKRSRFVHSQIGVGNMSEPSALLGAHSDALLLPKTRYPKITVAVAAVKYRW